MGNALGTNKPSPVPSQGAAVVQASSSLTATLSPTTAPTPALTQLPVVAVPPPAVPTPGNTLSGDGVASLLEAHKGDFLAANLDDLHVTVFAAQDEVDIRVKPSFMLNEADVIRMGGADALLTSQQVFGTYKSVNLVRVEVDADFTDAYGNTSTGVAANLAISRTTAAKISYEGMKGMPASQPWCVADIYYIAPAIWNALNEGDRGCLTAPSSAQ
ncbi:MAG: hypothetical protein ACLQBX_18805 [Candidatus Limnocylindrales bacterium]